MAIFVEQLRETPSAAPAKPIAAKAMPTGGKFLGLYGNKIGATVYCNNFQDAA